MPNNPIHLRRFRTRVPLGGSVGGGGVPSPTPRNLGCLAFNFAGLFIWGGGEGSEKAGGGVRGSPRRAADPLWLPGENASMNPAESCIINGLCGKMIPCQACNRTRSRVSVAPPPALPHPCTLPSPLFTLPLPCPLLTLPSPLPSPPAPVPRRCDVWCTGVCSDYLLVFPQDLFVCLKASCGCLGELRERLRYRCGVPVCGSAGVWASKILGSHAPPPPRCSSRIARCPASPFPPPPPPTLLPPPSHPSFPTPRCVMPIGFIFFINVPVALF